MGEIRPADAAGSFGCGARGPAGRGTEVSPPATGQPVGLGEPAVSETTEELARILVGVLQGKVGISFPGTGALGPSQWVVAWGPGVGPQPIHIPGWLWEKVVGPLLRDRGFWDVARGLALAGEVAQAMELVSGRVLPLVEQSGRWGLAGG